MSRTSRTSSRTDSAPPVRGGAEYLGDVRQRRTRCPHCRQPTITTVDNNPAGLPIVLHPHPTSRLHALTTIANGHRAVIADSDGDWRHPSTSYWVLDAWRIPNTNLERRPHYVEHQCGTTPPPPDPPTPPPACACDWCQRIGDRP